MLLVSGRPQGKHAVLGGGRPEGGGPAARSLSCEWGPSSLVVTKHLLWARYWDTGGARLDPVLGEALIGWSLAQNWIISTRCGEGPMEGSAGVLAAGVKDGCPGRRPDLNGV